MPTSPHVRELRAKAVTYARVVSGWGTYVPTPAQLQAMIECVAELEHKVVSAKREVSGVRPRSSAPLAARRESTAVSVPPGSSWNARVGDATGVRPRNSTGATQRPPESATSRPPPVFSSRVPVGTVPPVSSPRAIPSLVTEDDERENAVTKPVATPARLRNHR